MTVVNAAPAPQFPSSDFGHMWNEYIGLPAQEFKATPYGELVSANDSFSLELMTYAHRDYCPQYNGANYAYQIADVSLRMEDEIDCWFQVYQNINAKIVLLGYAEVGVTWVGVENTMSKGELGIQWPIRNSAFYVPYPTKMSTPETGGYMAQVLDRYIPCEGMKFGLTKGYQGQAHTGCVIKWVLAPVREDYPWQG